ncbi:MAG: hypothetical protein II511_04960, partial [Bacteroidales bacterium]|nr:hypothetical protein [Bacteroidales bacterium]
NGIIAVVAAIPPCKTFVIALKACSPDSISRVHTQMLHHCHQPPAGYFWQGNADNARLRVICWFGISPASSSSLLRKEVMRL